MSRASTDQACFSPLLKRVSASGSPAYWLCLVLLLVTVILGLCGLAAGSSGWSIAGQADWSLIRAIRAPRTVGAFLAGNLLGLGGAIAQGVFRNPLADPYLLGSASGATLAIVVSIALGEGLGIPLGISATVWIVKWGLVGAAFGGALAGVSLTLLLARGARAPSVLLLAGVVVGVLLGAFANLMMMLSPEALRGAQIFLLGTTGLLGWRSVGPLAVVLAVCLPVAVRFSRVLDALVLGEATALSMGVAVTRMRLLLVVLLALCTGTAVAEIGLVAFVGLVAPHLVRRTVVVTHGALLVLSSLTGGVLLLAADVVARSVLPPQELPVGLLTAIVGGAYLLVLLRQRSAGFPV